MGAYEFQTGDYIVYVAPDGSCANKTPCFSTILEAIAIEPKVFTIRAEEWAYPEDPVLDQGKEIAFQGGWNHDFTGVSGCAQVGSMTIESWALVLDAGCLAIGD